MRALIILNLSIALTCAAQTLIKPKSEATFQKVFDVTPSGPTLDCEVTSIPAFLDFSLRFQTGFSLDLPLGQFQGPHHVAIIVLRVTPENAAPAYLMTYVHLPDGSRISAHGYIRGGFAVGEGKYKVDALVKDDLGRVSHSHWSITAKAAGDERAARLSLPPMTVAGLSSAISSAPSPSNQLDFDKLTILLHVQPPSPSQATLPASDEKKLVGALSAMMTQLRARSVRLVLFNLDQQKVLFRKDGSTAADIDSVAQLIHQMRFGLVDYATLNAPGRGMDLLAQLTEDELGQLHGSDALIILGPRGQVNGAIPAGIAKRSRGGAKVFYLECAPALAITAAAQNSDSGISAASSTFPPQDPEPVNAEDFDDTDNFTIRGVSDETLGPSVKDPIYDEQDGVERLVRRLKGEVILIRRPVDCAHAIQRIAQHDERSKCVGKTRMMDGSCASQPPGTAHQEPSY